MKTYKLIVLLNFFCLTLVFTSCHNSNQEDPDKNAATDIGTDPASTIHVSRDTVVKDTIVTPVPSPSAIPAY